MRKEDKEVNICTCQYIIATTVLLLIGMDFFNGFLIPVLIRCVSLQLKGNYIAALYSLMLTIATT